MIAVGADYTDTMRERSACGSLLPLFSLMNLPTYCVASLFAERLFLRVGLPQRHQKSPAEVVERLTDAVCVLRGQMAKVQLHALG